MQHPKVAFLWAGLVLAALAPSRLAAQIARPQLGTVMDASGSLRPVIGVAAAAALGDSALDHASSFACSATLCLAKTDDALIPFAPANAAGTQTPTAGTPGLPGAALIAIDDQANARAWIYFTQLQQAALWQDGALTMIDFAPAGEVLSLRAASDGFDYVVVRDRSRGIARAGVIMSGNLRRRAANAWIEHYSASDGSITVVGAVANGAVAGDGVAADGVASSARFADSFAVTAVLLFDGGVLVATRDQLILTRPDGQQMAFPLAGAQAFFQAAKGVVEIVAPHKLWILRTDPGSEQLALLPGAPQGDVPVDTPVNTLVNPAEAGQ